MGHDALHACMGVSVHFYLCMYLMMMVWILDTDGCEDWGNILYVHAREAWMERERERESTRLDFGVVCVRAWRLGWVFDPDEESILV